MRAGLLKERVEFISISTTQSQSGAMTRSEQSVLVTRCYRLKMQGGLASVAYEDFVTSTVVIQVRQNPLIKEDQTFIYQNKQYQIENIDLRVDDRTLVITGKKKNK